MPGRVIQFMRSEQRAAVLLHRDRQLRDGWPRFCL
jgi:hypothetical protein